jgi:hypothetical protein
MNKPMSAKNEDLRFPSTYHGIDFTLIFISLFSLC